VLIVNFSVDLVAEDHGGGTVVIENQLEKSNHEECLAIAVFIHDMRAARVPNYPSRPLASGYEQMHKSARVPVHMTQPQTRF
jgi:hypothetical protein